MRKEKFSINHIDQIMSEIYHDINLLYLLPCAYSRNQVLNHLMVRIEMIESITKAMNRSARTQLTSESVNTEVFTQQELSKFDGKNGNPAYVAVNGTVYDVTNNAAWAAATHFGLTAGKDLTSQFASCHGGQPILSKLTVVGKLV